MAELSYKHDDATIRQVAPGPTSSDEGKSSVWDEVFYNESSSAIAAGDWVVVDITGTTHGVGRSIKESTTTADEVCVGVALEAIADDDWGKVRRRGLISDETDREGVTVSVASVSDGDALATNTTAGAATTAANTDVNVVGVVWDAASPLVVEVRC